MTTVTVDTTRVASWRLLLRNPVTVVSAVVLAIVVLRCGGGQLDHPVRRQ